MAERNPYHLPAGSSRGGEFTSGQLGKIVRAARTGAGVNPHWVDFDKLLARDWIGVQINLDSLVEMYGDK